MGFLGISKPTIFKSNVERYRDYLESLVGKKCEVFRTPSNNKKLPHVFALVFRGYPSDGYITTFTHGVSYVHVPERAILHTELMLQVNSDNINWSHALAFLANHLREKCPFQIGQTLHFGQQIAADSGMTDFLVYEALPEFTDTIPVNHKTDIQLVQLLPIHPTELSSIRRLGWKKFAEKLGQDRNNINRISLGTV